MTDKTILITGSAGFIGYHLTKKILKNNINVVGIDNMNDYYDIGLKKSRLNSINQLNNKKFTFIEADIACRKKIEDIFNKYNIDIVINLAAQAGVRYSLEKPEKYIDSNIVGFSNILELCRKKKIKHLLYASSSSIYGMNRTQPFAENDLTDSPISLYAATKKSNELMAFSYSHLYNIPCTGLRFFTVYGPYGRPDMAYYSFTSSILKNKTINIFNNGEMLRDFTYIDDIVECIYKLIDKTPKVKENPESRAAAPHEIYNIGNDNPVKLIDFVKAIESACGVKAKLNFLPMQPGDVPITHASIDKIFNLINFKPTTNINHGIEKFVKWYKDYEN